MTLRDPADGRIGRLHEFAAAALALVAATALKVAVGSVLGHDASVRHLQAAAAIGAIGSGARKLLHG